LCVVLEFGERAIVHRGAPGARWDEAHPMNDGCLRQSPSVSSDAFPPAAVVFTVNVLSVANRSK
jgi:hypothetical protein